LILDLALLLAKNLCYEESKSFRQRMKDCLALAIQTLVNHAEATKVSSEEPALKRLVRLLVRKHDDFEARPFLFCLHSLLSKHRAYDRVRVIDEGQQIAVPDVLLRFSTMSSNSQLLEAIRMYCLTLYENKDHDLFLRLMRFF
jgi:hypothetical protein